MGMAFSDNGDVITRAYRSTWRELTLLSQIQSGYRLDKADLDLMCLEKAFNILVNKIVVSTNIKMKGKNISHSVFWTPAPFANTAKVLVGIVVQGYAADLLRAMQTGRMSRELS